MEVGALGDGKIMYLSHCRLSKAARFCLKKIKLSLVVAHDINPSTREAEAGRSLTLRLAWSIEQVLGQSGLHREALTRKLTNKYIKRRVLVAGEMSQWLMIL